MIAQTALTGEALKVFYFCQVTTEVILFSFWLTGENETKRGLLKWIRDTRTYITKAKEQEDEAPRCSSEGAWQWRHAAERQMGIMKDGIMKEWDEIFILGENWRAATEEAKVNVLSSEFRVELSFFPLLLLLHNLSHKPPKPWAAEKLSNKMSYMHLQSNTLVSVWGYKQGSFIAVCKMEHQICLLATDKGFFHLEYWMKEVKTCYGSIFDEAGRITLIMNSALQDMWLVFLKRFFLILKQLKEHTCLKHTHTLSVVWLFLFTFHSSRMKDGSFKAFLSKFLRFY